MKKLFYPSILCLEDGMSYKGWSFFNILTVSGEVVFNTGMTGYQEILTDPSYTGQIMTFTYPELGNTGLNNHDNESHYLHVKGIIAKNICLNPSNWRKQISMKDYLDKYKIPHIFGIDTRALTKHIRSSGVMKASISSNILDKIDLVKNINLYKDQSGSDLIKYIDVNRAYRINTCSYKSFISWNTLDRLVTFNNIFLRNIVVLDFGIKHNILSYLLMHGCNIIILPSNSTYDMIRFYNPDAILLSNGPGDPSKMYYVLNTIKKIIKFSNIPIFGICMGHQLLSLAYGAITYKLKFGHRGLNHPVGLNQNIDITSQNHGFVVELDSVDTTNKRDEIEIISLNGNDNTIASILSLTKPIFSVQYHPESSPGPHDSDYLFAWFMNLIYLYQ